MHVSYNPLLRFLLLSQVYLLLQKVLLYRYTKVSNKRRLATVSHRAKAEKLCTLVSHSNALRFIPVNNILGSLPDIQLRFYNWRNYVRPDTEMI